MKDRAIGIFTAMRLLPIMQAAVEILNANAEDLGRDFLLAAEDHYDDREHDGRMWFEFWKPKIDGFEFQKELDLMNPLPNFEPPRPIFRIKSTAWHQFSRLYNRDIEAHNDAVTILESMTEGGAEFVHMSTELFYKYYNLVNREEESDNAE